MHSYLVGLQVLYLTLAFINIHTISITPGRQQSKTPILSRNSIAICRLTDDKWQSQTPFISIFDPHWSIVDNIFNCLLSTVYVPREGTGKTVNFNLCCLTFKFTKKRLMVVSKEVACIHFRETQHFEILDF